MTLTHVTNERVVTRRVTVAGQFSSVRLLRTDLKFNAYFTLVSK